MVDDTRDENCAVTRHGTRPVRRQAHFRARLSVQFGGFAIRKKPRPRSVAVGLGGPGYPH